MELLMGLCAHDQFSRLGLIRRSFRFSPYIPGLQLCDLCHIASARDCIRLPPEDSIRMTLDPIRHRFHRLRPPA